MKAFVSRKECILARYEFGAHYKRFWCAIQMFSERETNSNQSQVGFLIDLNWSSCLRNPRFTECNNDYIFTTESYLHAVLKQISFTVQLAGLHTNDRSIITCYDVTNSPEPVRPVTRVRFDRVGDVFFRSNSRWYGCCDWLLVPRSVSLDSHRTWTDSWCADLLPRNNRIHSRNKCIHSGNMHSFAKDSLCFAHIALLSRNN